MKTIRKIAFYALRLTVVLAVIIGFLCIAGESETLNLGFAKTKLLGFGLIFLAIAIGGFNSTTLFPAEEINDDERI